MKKILALILAALMIIFTFSSCGKGGDLWEDIKGAWGGNLYDDYYTDEHITESNNMQVITKDRIPIVPKLSVTWKIVDTKKYHNSIHKSDSFDSHLRTNIFYATNIVIGTYNFSDLFSMNEKTFEISFKDNSNVEDFKKEVFDILSESCSQYGVEILDLEFVWVKYPDSILESLIENSNKETNGTNNGNNTETDGNIDNNGGADNNNTNNDHNNNDNNDNGGDNSTDTYVRTGNKITFGSYPQTEVKDSALISTLNSKAGTLPASSNVHSWSSYGYYINGKEENFMWYKDVSHNGERYRGVYFTSYRPFSTTGSSSSDIACQKDNGYILNNIYWFKYEPISWTILSEDTTNKTALVLCDMIIDSQEYYISNSGTRTIDGKTVYPNNYAYSTIRNWLNEEFYNTAFIELQKQIICTTTVYNNAESTGYSNTYACENTEDKIFLLSAQEVTNTVYGFVGNSSSYDIARKMTVTDYAQVQGVDTIIDEKGYWWLRSPNRRYQSYARLIDEEGCLDGTDVASTNKGIVPALQIRL